MDKKNILIVGNKVKHLDLANILKKYYSYVLSKDCSEESLEKLLDKNNFDIIITSVRIGNMDAFTFFNNIKQKNRALPKVILVYSYSSSVIEVLAKEFGFVCLDEKNFDVTDVICAIERDIPNVENERNIPFSDLSDEERKKAIYSKATEMVRNTGIPTNIKGYYYLRDAIIMCVEYEDSCLISYTKQLCPEIAKKHGASLSSIDRSIRHAIDVAWDTSSFIHEKMHHKPTSFQLITSIADIIRTMFMS